MVGFIQQLLRRTPLGWRQLIRQKGRFLVSLSGIAFADVLMFMQLGFETALYDSNTRLHRSMQGDIFIISPQARNLADMSTFTRRRLLQSMDIPGVKSAQGIYLGIVSWKNPQKRNRANVLAIGFNPDKPAFDIPEINRQLSTIKIPDTFLFDRGARGEYQETIAQISQGNPVTTEVGRRTITISGLFQVGASFASDGSIVTSDQNFLRLFQEREAGSVSIGLLQLKTGYDPKLVALRLKSHLGNDVKILTRVEFIQFEDNHWRTSTAIGFIFSLGVTMGFFVGVIIVYQVLSTDVNTHIKEYATLKAMGYRNIHLLGIVFEEAIIMSILGFIPGFCVSFGLYTLTRNATNLPIYMTLTRAIQIQILTFIMCMISGAIATRKIQSADPADMF